MDKLHKCFKRNKSTKETKSAEKVYIWDLDETLIIYQSLLNAEFARKHGKNQRQCENIGLNVETVIFELADNNLYFMDFEENNPTNVNDTITKNENQNREKFNEIKEIYNRYPNNIDQLMNTRELLKWNAIKLNLMHVTEPWHAISRNCLKNVRQKKNRNVIVTTTHLIPAIAKIMLYDLSEYIEIDDVYSATFTGKKFCFEIIQNKFRKNASYVAIGDGKEERQAARMVGIPFQSVQSYRQLKNVEEEIRSGVL